MCEFPPRGPHLVCVRRINTGRRYVVEAIKKHMVDENVKCAGLAMMGMPHANLAQGRHQVPSKVGRIRQQEGLDMGARGEPLVSPELPPLRFRRTLH